MIYLQLLWSFFQIGLFSIGGGYAAMPLIQNQVVDLHPWLTMSQFADIMAIAEMTPGPIAINSATFVGIQVAGIPGALVATAGCVLPSCIIVMTLAYIYYRFRGLKMVQGVLAGLRPAVVAMIVSAGVSLMTMAFYGERERNNWPCLYEIPIDAICGRKSEKNMKKAVEFGKNSIAKPSGICYNIPVIHTLPQLTRWVAVLSGPAFPVFEKRQKGQA